MKKLSTKVPYLLRIKQITLGCFAIGLLALPRVAQGTEVTLNQMYATTTRTAVTSATFDPGGITGIGSEFVPLTSFTMTFSNRGYLQTACIVPTVIPYPAGTLLAQYQNGIFLRLVSSGSGRIGIKPRGNSAGAHTITIMNEDLLDNPCCAGFIRYDLLSSAGPCIRVEASASIRNAGANPLSYSAAKPLLGRSWTASVDLSTTGHSRALVYGFSQPISSTLGAGQVLLIGGTRILSLPSMPGPLATWSLTVPSDCALVGVEYYTQALHIGGVLPFALSNAVDLVIGF